MRKQYLIISILCFILAGLVWFMSGCAMLKRVNEDQARAFFFLGQAADAHSTKIALDMGAIEGNPLYNSDMQSIIQGKILLIMFSTFLAEVVYPDHKPMIYGIVGLSGFVGGTVNSYGIVRRL